MQVETFIDTFGKRRKLNLRFHREATMRYRANSAEELLNDGAKLLDKLVKHHQSTQAPRLQELKDYAVGNNHAVLTGDKRRKEEDMSDSRLVHDFGGMVSVFKQGYLTGIPIRVDYLEDDDSIKQTLEAIAVENDFNELNRALVLDLSQMGRAYDIVYRNHKDQTRVRKLDALQTFVIYDYSLDQHSVGAVRYYERSGIDDKEQLFVELYTDSEIIHFEYVDNTLEETRREAHAFEDVPITEWLNNEEGMGDYENVLSLIDGYDFSQSDTSNYMTDLSDAILAIIGSVSLPDDLSAEQRLALMKDMRKARLLHLVPPTDIDGRESGNVDAKYLYKQYDVAGTEAYKTRLATDIHKLTNVPDLSDANFSGNQSGESMKYKVFGLDQKVATTQALFEKALKRRYELIATVAMKANELSAFDMTKIKATFTLNLPKSLKEIIDNFTALGGEISNQTAMRLTNIVDNPESELEALDSQASREERLSKALSELERRTDADLNASEDVIADE